MPIVRRSLCVGLILLGCRAAEGQAQAQGFTMRPPPEFGVEVAGPRSRLANPNDWPVTYIFRVPGRAGCTATAVGEQVVITAAHCLPSGGQGTLTIGTQQWSVTCEQHPQWLQSRSADFALCHVEVPMNRPAVGFEALAADAAAVTQSSEIILVGFGCRYDGSPGFGLLAEGRTNITGLTGEFIETGAGSTLCTGDSGGAAYVASGTLAAQRRVVALNHGVDGNRSLLSRITNPQFQSWAKQWSAAKGARVCGLDPGATNCRP